jgi:hypothetical protein
MGQKQLTTIETAIAEVFEDDDSNKLCCTVDAVNSEGEVVSIQVMADAMSILPYPYSDEPVARLKTSGALDELEEMDLEIVDWEADGFAIVGIGGNAPSDIARLVEQTFTHLLGCDEANYSIAASTEHLG